MGLFSVSPCNGSLHPGSQQVVTVECVSDQLGCWNQGLLIDISDRDPLDHPDGIPYKLLAEVCKPGESYVNIVLRMYNMCYIMDTSALSSSPSAFPLTNLTLFCPFWFVSQVYRRTWLPSLRSTICVTTAVSSPQSSSAMLTEFTSRTRTSLFSTKSWSGTRPRPASNSPTTARCPVRSAWPSNTLALR